VAFLSALSLRAADKITIHGYVVAVNSPTNFSIDDYSITNPNKLNLDFAGGGGQATLRPEEVPVGTEVEITGELNPATRQIKVSTIKIVTAPLNGPAKATAILDRLPSLERTASRMARGRLDRWPKSAGVRLHQGNTTAR